MTRGRQKGSETRQTASTHTHFDDRLDSWKEIAVYLKRDVRTVQRWEKREGLPVHRHVHDKLCSVYAYRAEIDAWWGGDGAATLPSSSPNNCDLHHAHSRTPAAVFFFDNLGNDRSLNWLRFCLADILIAGLTQSPYIDVLGMDRLYQMLKDLNYPESHITASDVVRAVAKRAGVRMALLGSFFKLEDTYRVNVRCQEATTGKILRGYTVEAVGESNILQVMDNLTRRICMDVKFFEASSF